MCLSQKSLDAALAMNDQLFAQAKRIEKLTEALEKIASPRGVLTAAQMRDIADKALQEDRESSS